MQYRRRLVILGDICAYRSGSSAFAAFVSEANHGDDLWFVADHAELARRLERHVIEGQAEVPLPSDSMS